MTMICKLVDSIKLMVMIIWDVGCVFEWFVIQRLFNTVIVFEDEDGKLVLEEER